MDPEYHEYQAYQNEADIFAEFQTMDGNVIRLTMWGYNLTRAIEKVLNARPCYLEQVAISHEGQCWRAGKHVCRFRNMFLIDNRQCCWGHEDLLYDVEDYARFLIRPEQPDQRPGCDGC